jgi:AcrR family transcriptional regulator
MPRDTLTRDQIVKAAIDLLDTEGLDGFSLRTLGKRLGSAATAIYWHVSNKDNLIALAADEVWQEIPLPDLVTTDWRSAARQMATDLYSMLIRHPWLVQAFSTLVIYGPGKARHDDHNLAVYEAAGFISAQADQAVATVFTFSLGNALGPAAESSLTRKLSREGGNADEELRESMAKAKEIVAQFPRLRARLDAPGSYAAAPENTFEFGLNAILDGLQAGLSDRVKIGAKSS